MSVTVADFKKYGEKKYPHRNVDLPVMKPVIKQVPAPDLLSEQEKEFNRLMPTSRCQIEQAQVEAKQLSNFAIQILAALVMLTGIVTIGTLITSGKLPL